MADSNSTRNYPTSADLTNKTFGRWTVITEAEKRKSRRFWHCRCECGNEATVDGKELRIGRSTGCIRCRNRTHGKSAECPEYSIWKGICSRCQNPNNQDHHHYAGRGIRLSDDWKSFEAFYRDMGPRPSPKHTVERLDNSLGYSAENCQWDTRKAQARNTRRNHMLTFNGETHCISEWAEQLGMSCKALHSRIRNGWTTEEALTIPDGGRRTHCSHLLTFDGITICVADWARRLGISEETLHWRLSKNWSIERALTTPVRQQRSKQA